MKTFLEVEGEIGPVPTSQFRPPLPDTNPNIRKDNAAEKREQHLGGLGQQLLSLPPCIHPYQRSHLNQNNDVPDSQPLPSVPVHKSIAWLRQNVRQPI